MTSGADVDVVEPAGDSEVSRILSAVDVRVNLPTAEGTLAAVRGVSLDIHRGEVLALVGESGCGKTTFARALINLIRRRGGEAHGSVLFEGQDLLSIPDKALRKVRGRRIASIMQDSVGSLNPVVPIGKQIAEICRLHSSISRRAARARAVELLDQVQIPNPARRARDYPHQLSGGMRQRVVIAMAIAMRPALLLADEPTTALDINTKVEILELLKQLRRESGMAVLLVTHDLAMAAAASDRIAVMYAGKVVELGPAREVYATPRHPYTRGLVGAAPRLSGENVPLVPIVGSPADLMAKVTGCAFAQRCGLRDELCEQTEPELVDVAHSRRARCHHHDRVDTSWNRHG